MKKGPIVPGLGRPLEPGDTWYDIETSHTHVYETDGFWHDKGNLQAAYGDELHLARERIAALEMALQLANELAASRTALIDELIARLPDEDKREIV